MRFKIHRGAEEIGGNCIEVESGGKAILLDLGAPLMGDQHGVDALPPVRGLTDGSNPDLLGLVISHPHADHYGLVIHAHDSIPVFIGREADKLLRAAIAFGPFGAEFSSVRHYSDRVSFQIGPFKLTPYLADHSAFDSYSLLIEADGHSLFYSGDLRAHGWKKWAFDALLRDAPIGVDAMLLEGTTLGRAAGEVGMSEADLVEPLCGHMNESEGMVLAAFSGQNIDRFVTFYKAALKSGRTFVVDLYIAHLLRAIGRESLPDPTDSNLRVFLPHRTKLKIVRDESFDLVAPYRDRRIYPDEMRRRRGSLVMSFRASMAIDLVRADCLEGAKLVYSMWPGYLERDGFDLREWCVEHEVGFAVEHTSGHASASDLTKLVSAMQPKVLIPIHTIAPAGFEALGHGIQKVPNGRWFGF